MVRARIGSASLLRLVDRGVNKQKVRTKYTSYEEVVDMVLMTPGKPSLLAAKFNFSEKWVRTLQRFIAGTYLTFPLLVLGGLARHASERPPLFCVSRFAYDETGEKLTLNIAKQKEQRSVWQVMVARMMILIGWWDADVGRCTMWNFDVVLPTLLVASANADNLFRAIFVTRVWHQCGPLCASSSRRRSMWLIYTKLTGRMPALDCGPISWTRTRTTASSTAPSSAGSTRHS